MALLLRRFVQSAQRNQIFFKRNVTWKRCFSSAKMPPLTQLSQDELMMRETVVRFAKEKVAPLVKKMDEQSMMDKSIINGLFENGLMGIEVGQEYGGAGANFFCSILAIEELAKVDPSVSVFCDVQNTLIFDYFRRYASPELKEKYLNKMATDSVGCFCLSEPSCGSDAFALKASAKADGDHFVLNGEKSWITNAEHADIFLVMANVDFTKAYKGITCFVVDKNTPGLSVGKQEDKLGIRASSTCPVILEDCKVHKSQILGEVGQGYKYAIEVLNTGRIGIGAQMLGLAQGVLDHTVPYLKERKAFGTAIADFQAIRHTVATIATQIEAARLLVYNAARMKDNGEPHVQEGAMAKWFAGEVASFSSSKCVELLGGVGFTKDFPVEKYYRDCKIGAIYEGTSNIQLNTISDIVYSNY